MKALSIRFLLWAVVSTAALSCSRSVVPAPPTLENAWKDGWDAKKVLAIPKGQRPDPSTYLQEAYITYQLSLFQSGASYLVTKATLDNFGRELLGRPDNTQFVMPKQEMDRMLKKTGGNVAAIEKELGIPPKAWQNKPLTRINIPNPTELRVRLSNGNEQGANDLWLPGGKLPTGYSEAVVDRIPKGRYIETDL